MKLIILKIAVIFGYSHFFAGELQQLITSKDRDAYPSQIKSSDEDAAYDLKLYGDFIYWGAKVGNLSFAESGISPGTTSVNKGQIKSISTSWDPGFKVGADAFFDFDHWDVNFEYTRLVSSQSNQAGAGYIPLWNIGNVIGTSTNITASSCLASWHQSFNLLDINLGRECFVSEYLMIRPFFGIQGIYTTEHFNLNDLNVTTSSTLSANTNLSMKMSQFYWGLGIEAGMNSSWYLCKSFSIYGDLLVSALSSRFNTARKDYLSFVTSPNVSSQLVNTSNKFSTLKAFLDLGLGLVYDYKTPSWAFHMRAGWEVFLGFNYNQFIEVTTPSSDNGDLTMQGLTLEAGFSF